MSDASVITTVSWKRESGFIWAMLGSAIGFANVLSFSAKCYQNGGGAFLIPYAVAVLVLGLPMLFLEGAVGHRMHLPIVSAYGSVVGHVGKFFGWLSIIAVATIGGFYTVLTAYSVAYAYFFGAHKITSNTEEFWNDFLKSTDSISAWGGVSWPILICTLLVAFFSWFVMVRNIRSGVEKTCSIFLPLMMVLILFFGVVVSFLPGASIGFCNYLKPDFSKLASGSLWRDVFGQVFFSFSLGLGIVTGYSRHTKERTSIPRAMVCVALGDFLISFIAGFAIFGCVGYLSSITGVPFSEIIRSDSSFEIGFVIFPKILQMLGSVFAPITGVIFFFCIFIAGVTGLFSIIESITGNIEVEFGKSRKVAASVASGIIALLALSFCFGNSQSLLGALVPMVLGDNMLLGGIAEVVVFIYFSKLIRNDPIWVGGDRRTIAFRLLQFVVPVILLIILVSAISAEIDSGFGLSEAVRWGWFVVACGVSLALTWRTAKYSACEVTE
jgi:neurotransmitter:Na+ symporter, NSS family